MKFVGGNLVLKVIAFLLLLSNSYFIIHQSWSPIDEYAHMDYVEKLGRGHMPAISDTLEADLMKTVISEETKKASTRPNKTIDIGLARYSYQAKHPPFYYMLLVGPNEVMKLFGVSLFHRVLMLRLFGFYVFCIGLWLMIPIARTMRALNWNISNGMIWFYIDFALLILSHERYGLGNNIISLPLIHLAFFFLLRYKRSGNMRDLMWLLAVSTLSVSAALTNLFLIPIVLFPAVKPCWKQNHNRKWMALLAAATLPLCLLLGWYLLSKPEPQTAHVINQLLAHFIPAGKIAYTDFIELWMKDSFTIHWFHHTFYIGTGVAACMLFTLIAVFTMIRIGISKQTYWLLYLYGAFLFFFVLTFFLNQYVDRVTWVALRHYLGFLPILETGIFGFLFMQTPLLFRWLKLIVPKSWKDYIHQVLAQKQFEQKEDLEQRLGNISLHQEHVSALLTSTIHNLNSVGGSLEVIHQTLQGRLDRLEDNHAQHQKGLHALEVSQLLLYRQLPDVLPLDESNQRVLREFLSERSCTLQLNTAISKYDVMFLYSLANYKDFNTALHHYLTVGYSGYHLVYSIQQQVIPEWKPAHSILDFASGYGRITRFLAAHYGAEGVYTSDIKKEAVDFQVSELGVHGLYSSYIPEEFQPNRTFDLIFVGSLFSHLNRDLFERWLHRLIQMVSKDGCLIFTVHDMELHPTPTELDHVFVASNEDVQFEFVANRITSTSHYGISFVTEDFILSLLKKIDQSLEYRRFKKAFAGLQDVYIVGSGEWVRALRLE